MELQYQNLLHVSQIASQNIGLVNTFVKKTFYRWVGRQNKRYVFLYLITPKVLLRVCTM